MQLIFSLSLIFSILIVLLSIIPLSIARFKVGYSLSNMSTPRALFDDLPEFGKRSVWCHQNCWESISIHAPACLLCLYTLPESKLSLLASIAHPAARFVYIFAYIFNFPIARGISWAIGILCTLTLLIQGVVPLL